MDKWTELRNALEQVEITNCHDGGHVLFEKYKGDGTWSAAKELWAAEQKELEAHTSHIITKGVVDCEDKFPLCDSNSRREMVEGLYQLAIRAIEIFEKESFAFIRFPNQTIEYRTFGGFYGSPWNREYHWRTLEKELKKRLPGLDIHFITLRQREYNSWEERRTIGVLFAYL